MMHRITVIGSINMDVVNQVERHPLPGETVKGFNTSYMPGGKGANQAVAASLSGSQVTMIGAVGQDPFASQLLTALKSYGVGTASLAIKACNSGMAFITVDAAGENNIILSEGANGLLTIEDIQARLDVWDHTDMLILQNEIPWETNEYAIQEAKKRGIYVILNPAPAMNVPTQLFNQIDLIVVNETEIEAMTGMWVDSEEQGKAALDKLIQQGAQQAVLTMGKNGSIYIDQRGEKMHIPAFKVTPIDTTAAGDTFIGGLASAIGNNSSMKEALRFATAAAAISVTAAGAQEAIPTLEQINHFLAKEGPF